MKNSYIKIIILLFGILSYSCANSYEATGIYLKNQTQIDIKDQKIEIDKNFGSIRYRCIGTYVNYSLNRIKINCIDYRGDSINIGSVVNVVPHEFTISNEIIKIKKNKIIFQGEDYYRVR